VRITELIEALEEVRATHGEVLIEGRSGYEGWREMAGVGLVTLSEDPSATNQAVAAVYLSHLTYPPQGTPAQILDRDGFHDSTPEWITRYVRKGRQE
jgi:LPS sulfotransferase NodH